MGVHVTDHALVRWLARTGAMDVEAMRAMLAASLTRAAAAAYTLDARAYLIAADGLIYLIRDGRLITVLEDDGLHTHARVLAREARR